MAERSSVFPFKEALAYCTRSIRVRFLRVLMIMISIVLGVAFMVWLLTWSHLVSVLGVSVGKEVQAYGLWVALLSLIICGIGIVNSTLMAVYERYGEIGTLKCLGAIDSHILKIFVLESFLLGLIGGVIGAFAGWGIAVLWCGMMAGFPPELEAATIQTLVYVGEAIAIAVLLAVAASAYPAYRAAKLNPADALRKVV